MKALKASVWIMAIMAVILIIGSIGTSMGIFEQFYSSVFILLPTAIFLAALIWGIVAYPLCRKKIGFFVGHVGMVVVVISAVLSMIWKVDTSFAIPINSNLYFDSVSREDGPDVSFGFDISVSDFEVIRYDPDYRLFEMDPSAEGGMKVLEETVIMDRKGVFHMGRYGNISRTELEQNGTFAARYELGDGKVLIKLPQADKAYVAQLNLRDPTSGEKWEAEISVNHPYTYKGWKFYLMDYDRETNAAVQMYAKKDPGNISFGIGLCMVVTGIFVMCYGKLVKAGKGKQHEKS